VAAAIKLVPLGQAAGQRILSALIGQLPEVMERGLVLADDEIGVLAPRLAIGSARHETQYTRLFRS
jgi:urease accessory protein